MSIHCAVWPPYEKKILENLQLENQSINFWCGLQSLESSIFRKKWFKGNAVFLSRLKLVFVKWRLTLEFVFLMSLHFTEAIIHLKSDDSCNSCLLWFGSLKEERNDDVAEILNSPVACRHQMDIYKKVTNTFSNTACKGSTAYSSFRSWPRQALWLKCSDNEFIV